MALRALMSEIFGPMALASFFYMSGRWQCLTVYNFVINVMVFSYHLPILLKVFLSFVCNKLIQALN